MKKQRIKYLIAFTILLCIEILIAICVHDIFIRPYVGDLLVVIVLYCMVRIIIPDKYRLMPLWIFIFATVIVRRLMGVDFKRLIEKEIVRL